MLQAAEGGIASVWVLTPLDWLNIFFSQELLSSSPSLKEPKVCICTSAVICSYFFLVSPIPIFSFTQESYCQQRKNRWSKPTYLRCHYKTPNLGCPKASIIFRLVSQFSWQNMWSSTLYCRLVERNHELNRQIWIWQGSRDDFFWDRKPRCFLAVTAQYGHARLL